MYQNYFLWVIIPNAKMYTVLQYAIQCQELTVKKCKEFFYHFVGMLYIEDLSDGAAWTDHQEILEHVENT